MMVVVVAQMDLLVALQLLLLPSLLAAAAVVQLLAQLLVAVGETFSPALILYACHTCTVSTCSYAASFYES